MKTFQTTVTVTYSKVIHVRVEAEDRDAAYALVNEALSGIPAEDISGPGIEVTGSSDLSWDEESIAPFDEIDTDKEEDQ